MMVLVYLMALLLLACLAALAVITIKAYLELPRYKRESR